MTHKKSPLEKFSSGDFQFIMPYAFTSQGKRIRIQSYYECRRHDTPAKPRVEWGQSPKWNPG